MRFVRRRPNARSRHTVEVPAALGKWMLGKWKIIFVVVITLLLIFARNTEPAIVQFSGSIVAHVGASDSETSQRSALTETGQLTAGFDYGNEDIVDWNAHIDWSLMANGNEADKYRLVWTFLPDKGSATTGTKDFAFDGVNQVIVAVNELLSITIDPEPSEDE